ncbi:MAG: hypothetical protein M1376_08440 [Planctomycetes bacterium]|nr:hypothetical protein [Planctomycetota bacterium]
MRTRGVVWAMASVLMGLVAVGLAQPVTGDLSKAVAAQLVWSSWSPGYLRGISINGAQVFETEGPKYQYYFHRVNVSDPTVFKPGMNTLVTGKTPLINGQMVHGMEVNWPGIMVLIQYAEENQTSGRPTHR